MCLPILVLFDSGVPKKRTEEMMIATLFTTLHTPCDTGLTLDSVLNANCRSQMLRRFCAAMAQMRATRSQKIKRDQLELRNRHSIDLM